MFDLEAKDGETKSLIGKTREGFFEKSNEIKTKVTTAIDTGSNYYAAFAFFVIGALFLLLAFTFLPIVLLSPGKFNTFFSLGSCFIQLGLAFYNGPLNYLKMLFKKENLTISLVYVVTLVLALYASMFWGSYFSTIVLILLQVIRERI